jgi:proteasome lid subunit RPN8/RPN11
VGTALRPRGGPLPWQIIHDGVVGDIEEHKTRLFLHSDVVGKIERRSKESALRRREDMGLLLGERAKDLEGDEYAVAMDLLTGPLDASPVSVRFKMEGLIQVAQGLDDLDYPYVIVGWYHTHLDLGCFLSDKDMKTQRGGFPHPHQVAVVVDPMRGEAGAFANGTDGPGSLWAVMESYDGWEPPKEQGI